MNQDDEEVADELKTINQRLKQMFKKVPGKDRRKRTE